MAFLFGQWVRLCVCVCGCVDVGVGGACKIFLVSVQGCSEGSADGNQIIQPSPQFHYALQKFSSCPLKFSHVKYYNPPPQPLLLLILVQ